MAVTSMYLAEGSRQMLLYPRADLAVLSFNAGSPTVRAVTENRPDDDGERDTTERHGGRAVAIDLRAIEDPAGVQDEVSSFLGPAARPYLVVADDRWAQVRRLRLRFDQMGGPIDADQAPTIRDMQFQWRAPDGVWEAAEETMITVSADIPVSVGYSYPKTYPLTYANTTASGALTVTNLGGAASHFTAKLYGPCVAPQLVNDLTGERISFSSALVLGAGEYVEVSTRDRTAYLNSDPAQSRLGQIEFGAPNTWWRIVRGTQDLRYTATTPEAGAAAVITYRPTWL